MNKPHTSIMFTEEFLRAYGCQNCIWKENNQCPENTSPDDPVKGYCSKLPTFLLGLSSPGDSISAVKEKFHLFVQEMQALTDRKDYLRIKQIYDLRIEEGVSPKDLIDLEVQMNTYKVWWSRLSEQVVKGLSRVVDREKRTKEGSKQVLNVQQLNLLMQDSAKKLIEFKEDKDE